MAKLPFNRVVNVSLTRNDAFPSRRGFGTVLFLSTLDKSGKVDATARTKLYASMDEVAADWASTDDFYKAANAAFSQNPRPTSIKAGFVDVGTATDADALKTELDAIYAYDTDWYFVTIDSAMRDEAYLDGLIEWIEAKNKMSIIDSNDPLLKDANDTTNIAARNKGEFERSAVFYHDDAAEYPAICLAAYMSTRNFDDANTAYTAKFKNLKGVGAVNVGSAAVTAITGFTPGVGQSESAGHMANTYIDIGSRNFVVEGSTLTANVFLDEVHATDWIILRTEEEALGIYLNNARIPFSNVGMQQLAGAPRTVMQQAVRAGFIDAPLDPESGEYLAEVEYTIPNVFDVPESQRKARIAPAIEVRFRYSGATHFSVVRYSMSF